MAQTKRIPIQDEETSLQSIKDQYPEFRRIMVKRMNEIVVRADVTRENLNDQVITSPGDLGDISVIDTSADYFLQLSNNLQDELVNIQDAFERMHRGTYGVCESCEDVISAPRLKLVPTTRFCIDCQSMAERTTEARDRTPSL